MAYEDNNNNGVMAGMKEIYVWNNIIRNENEK